MTTCLMPIYTHYTNFYSHDSQKPLIREENLALPGYKAGYENEKLNLSYLDNSARQPTDESYSR